MYNQLQKVINLVNKTGDRVIVVDSANPENIFVVMGLDEYEKIVGHTETKQIWQSKIRDLTEDELLDRINRDIAIWKSENDLAKYPSANSASLGEAEENKELPPTAKRWDYDIDFPAQDWFAAEREDSNIDDDFDKRLEAMIKDNRHPTTNLKYFSERHKNKFRNYAEKFLKPINASDSEIRSAIFKYTTKYYDTKDI